MVTFESKLICLWSCCSYRGHQDNISYNWFNESPIEENSMADTCIALRQKQPMISTSLLSLSCVFKFTYTSLKNTRAHVNNQNMIGRVEDGTRKSKTTKGSNLGQTHKIVKRPAWFGGSRQNWPRPVSPKRVAVCYSNRPRLVSKTGLSGETCRFHME